jgi:hypothetical protein
MKSIFNFDFVFSGVFHNLHENQNKYCGGQTKPADSILQCGFKGSRRRNSLRNEDGNFI